MYKASKLMNKKSFSSLWPWKWNENGNTNQQHRNVDGYQFLWWCPRKRNCLYCDDGTSAKQNNQIARDIIRFLLSSTKNGQKNMTKPCIHICVEFAFSSLWTAKVLQSVCWYMFKLKYVQALPSLFEHRVTFRKTRKKLIETAILMINLDHLKPATRRNMYEAWN